MFQGEMEQNQMKACQSSCQPASPRSGAGWGQVRRVGAQSEVLHPSPTLTEHRPESPEAKKSSCANGELSFEGDFVFY